MEIQLHTTEYNKAVRTREDYRECVFMTEAITQRL